MIFEFPWRRGRYWLYRAFQHYYRYRAHGVFRDIRHIADAATITADFGSPPIFCFIHFRQYSQMLATNIASVNAPSTKNISERYKIDIICSFAVYFKRGICSIFTARREIYMISLDVHAAALPVSRQKRGGAGRYFMIH